MRDWPPSTRTGTDLNRRDQLLAQIKRFRVLRSITSHAEYRETITGLIYQFESMLANIDETAPANAHCYLLTHVS